MRKLFSIAADTEVPGTPGFHNTYFTIEDLAIRCTNHLCDSYHVTDVNLHSIVSQLPGTDKILM